jgi:hypothetical protein
MVPSMARSYLCLAIPFLVVACNSNVKEAAPAPVASAAVAASAASSGSTQVTSVGQTKLGQAIDPNATPAKLADIAKDPHKFEKGTYATTGTVTAVCQHMGCWMEIKDDASEAHIRMAGHAFFVPKTASGHKAKVLAQVVMNDDEGCGHENDEKHDKTASANGKDGKEPKKGCRAEAEEQMGHPLAKLELVALGVELYD